MDGGLTMTMQIDIEKYKYGEALKDVLRIRDERQRIYGDDWMDMKEYELLAMLKVKLRRLEHFVIERKSEQVYEGKVDTIIDTVNYSLFMLQNIINERKLEDEKREKGE